MQQAPTTSKINGPDLPFLRPVNENSDVDASTLAAVYHSHRPDYHDEEDVSQLPVVQARVRRHVHELIHSCFSREQSHAYLVAMQRCPNLVMKETDPLQFVRYCRYRPLEGAQRLCLYWEERIKLFGSPHAFLPMVIGGGQQGETMKSALTEQDLLTLQAAFPALLPNNTTNGLKCLLLEPKWKVAGTVVENVLRACFYLFGIMAQDDDRTQVEGIHCLFMASTPRSPNVDWEFLAPIAYFMAKVFPVRIQNLHLIGVPHSKRPRSVICQNHERYK